MSENNQELHRKRYNSVVDFGTDKFCRDQGVRNPNGTYDCNSLDHKGKMCTYKPSRIVVKVYKGNKNEPKIELNGGCLHLVVSDELKKLVLRGLESYSGHVKH